jgi:ParB family chromosome partitioning protein
MIQKQIERVSIAQIRVANPRSRNQLAFRAIISNIAAIGLKKPITVSRRSPDSNGTVYDLVCGQGRLEAVAALGGKDIPAIITEAPEKLRFLMSLVENIARRRPRSSQLLYEVQRLKKAHCSNTAIAATLGLGRSYIDGVVRLLSCGEARLVQQVEAGTIPSSIAVRMATVGPEALQRTLSDAYRKGHLRGAKLRIVERLVATRSADANPTRQAKLKLSSRELMKEYEAYTQRQRYLVRHASIINKRLAILTTTLKELLEDREFTQLLANQGLNSVPEQLISRVSGE